jgi:hypothetical protein
MGALGDATQWYRGKRREPKILQTDSERVFIEGEVEDFLVQEKMDSSPYYHFQNLVERYTQTTNKGVSAFIQGQQFFKANHWDHTLFHFIDCRDSRKWKCKGKSPHQVLTRMSFNVGTKFHFAFGYFVVVRIPDDELRPEARCRDLRWPDRSFR